MPRKDGFATNPEMLADFTEQSRLLFIEAYERRISECGFPSDYRDKPLSLLELEVSTAYSHESDTAMTDESLRVKPLRERNLTNMWAELKNFEPDVLELRRSQAAALGNVILTPELNIGAYFTTGLAHADYQTLYVNKRGRSVDTFSPRPAKIVIAGATQYAKNARTYVAEYRALPADIQIELRFSHVPELPLNGEESTTFLLKYYHTMHRELLHKQQIIGRNGDANGLPVFQEYLQDKRNAAVACVQAKERARLILKDRGIEI